MNSSHLSPSHKNVQYALCNVIYIRVFLSLSLCSFRCWFFAPSLSVSHAAHATVNATSQTLLHAYESNVTVAALRENEIVSLKRVHAM